MAHPSSAAGSASEVALTEMQRVAYVMYTDNRIGDTIVFSSDGVFYRLQPTGKQPFRPLTPLVITVSFDQSKSIGNLTVIASRPHWSGPIFGVKGVEPFFH